MKDETLKRAIAALQSRYVLTDDEAKGMALLVMAAQSHSEPTDFPQQGKLPVNVKPLEWLEPTKKSQYPAWRAYGVGFAALIDTGRARVFGNFPLFINDVWDRQQHSTLDDAKAYAQTRYELHLAPHLENPQAPFVKCQVSTMLKSNGADYYVHLSTGNREITPHMFAERWKAAYEVEEWKWFFGQRPDKPDILSFRADETKKEPSNEGSNEVL